MNLACRIDPRKASAGCRQISLAVALLLPPGPFMPMSIAADVQSAPVSAGSLMEAVTSGTMLLNVRPRFEQVQQDGKREDAEAFTNRLLAGWRTLPYHGFSVTAEMINVFRIGDQHYNDTPVASPRYPTVADPEMTDVNQLFVDYTGMPQTLVRFGRQSLKLDNTRYVGNVEFRQVMQVFNGLYVENRSLPGVEVDYAHFDRVRNVFAQQLQTEIDLVRAAWTFMPGSQAVGFAYFQDQPITGQNTGFANNSNSIVGLRVNGAIPLAGEWKVLYTGEVARQDAHAGGDPRIDATYSRLGGGMGWGKTFVRADYERLGSNHGQYAFQTPLGTNHLFQGWADQFLTTPKTGIRDAWVSAGTAFNDVAFYTEFHRFDADFGTANYGHEWDLGVTYPFLKQLLGKIEYADFREGDVLAPATARKRDTRKLWLTLIYNY